MNTKNKSPNVLLVISDDHRADYLGCVSERLVETPNLDRLAENGTRFTNCYNMGSDCVAVCAPSRAALHTGNHPSRVVEEDTWGCIRSGYNLLGESFRNQGYETFAVGKWHNEVDTLQRSFTGGDALFIGSMSDHFETPLHGFSQEGEYPPETAVCKREHSSDRLANAAVNFLENRTANAAPFFINLAFLAPHDPRTPPAEFARKRYDGRVSLPVNFQPEHPFRIGDFFVRDEQLAGLPRRESEILDHLADYRGMLEHMDSCLGRVFEALERSGELENTIIVYTSDHGLAIGDHGLMGKQNVYEHSLKVPLILSGPGIPVGQVRDSFIYMADLHPTLCELTGVPLAESVVDTQSFRSLLDDPAASLRNEVHCHYRNYGRMIRKGNWKLSRLNSKDGACCWQLFNVGEDPRECHNRIDDPQCREVVESLRDRLLNEEERVSRFVLSQKNKPLVSASTDYVTN